MKIFSIVIIVIGIAMKSCHPHRIRDIGFLEHVQRTREFKCELPQPRSINVKDLLILEPNPDEQFYPTSTVLSRCDRQTGCCTGTNVCSPAEQEDVELVFLVKHLVDTHRPRHHEVIIAKNHTKCHRVAENRSND